jgi:RecA-family ATPase
MLKVRMASQIKARPVHWLIPGFIAKGHLAMFMGEGGKGKSQIMIAVAAAMSLGVPLCTFEPFHNPLPLAESVFIAGEDNWEDTVRPRIQAARGNPGMIGEVQQSTQYDPVTKRWKDVPFALDRDVEAVRDYFRKRPNCQLLVVDPINAYLGAKADSYKNADVRRVLEPFVRVAQEYRRAIVGIIHPNKAKTGKVVDWATGSAAFTNLARATTALLDDPEDETWEAAGKMQGRQIWCSAKRNIGAVEAHSLIFDIKSYQYQEPQDDGELATIDTSYIEFTGTVKANADAIWGKLQKKKANQTDGRLAVNQQSQKWLCKNALIQILHNSPMGDLPWPTLQDELDKARFKRGTINNARDELEEEEKIVVYRIPDTKVWCVRLPPENGDVGVPPPNGKLA